mgnify:CR=1 FL=1
MQPTPAQRGAMTPFSRKTGATCRPAILSRRHPRVKGSSAHPRATGQPGNRATGQPGNWATGRTRANEMADRQTASDRCTNDQPLEAQTSRCRCLPATAAVDAGQQPRVATHAPRLRKPFASASLAPKHWNQEDDVVSFRQATASPAGDQPGMGVECRTGSANRCARRTDSQRAATPSAESANSHMCSAR